MATTKKTTTKTKAAKAGKTADKAAAAPKLSGRYIEAVGRRKTAVARVRIAKGSGKFWVGEKTLADYFQIVRLRDTILAPLTRLDLAGDFDMHAKVQGGGVNAQAEAIRLGIARALVEEDVERKKKLRAFGFMTRDSRAVERKKYGLKKARRAPQWAKR
jgi:small subunit ribosomal protein S9